MNPTVAQFTRRKIIEGIRQLPESWQFKFKQMYSHQDLDAPIETVVEKMAPERLDWALTQVENSLRKYRAKSVQGA